MQDTPPILTYRQHFGALFWIAWSLLLVCGFTMAAAISIVPPDHFLFWITLLGAVFFLVSCGIKLFEALKGGRQITVTRGVLHSVTAWRSTTFELSHYGPVSVRVTRYKSQRILWLEADPKTPDLPKLSITLRDLRGPDGAPPDAEEILALAQAGEPDDKTRAALSGTGETDWKTLSLTLLFILSVLVGFALAAG